MLLLAKHDKPFDKEPFYLKYIQASMDELSKISKALDMLENGKGM